MSDIVKTLVNPVQAALGSLGSPLMGILGGDQGGASGPVGANLQNPISQDQLNGANAAVNTGQNNQAAFLQALQAQNGLQNQSNVFNQLQGVANGTGPNPAQAMLANSTGNNIASQAALMAGQRGAGANPGLIARQAANSGANIQQQAAGQGAALQAQQSLNALNQMGQVAGQQAGQLAQGQQGYTNAALQGQQNVLGGVGGYNNALVGQQSNINNVNSATNLQRGKQFGDLIGNLAGGAGAALMLAEGGEVGPKSSYGQKMHGKVPAMVSPGEKYLTPKDVQQVKQGANPMKVGETIPGKPKVGGAKDDYKNDTVSKKLDKGGVVIPRSVTKSTDADRKAQAFVAAVLARK